MVDNRPERQPSLRTALSRVKGLGAAGHGSGDWWLHRITAVSNIPLVLALVVIVAMLSGRPYPEAARIVSHPLVALLLILAIISVTNHMRRGVQVIIEDYVHEKGLKLPALIANYFYSVLIAVACLYAVLRISFGAPA